MQTSINVDVRRANGRWPPSICWVPFFNLIMDYVGMLDTCAITKEISFFIITRVIIVVTISFYHIAPDEK